MCLNAFPLFQKAASANPVPSSATNFRFVWTAVEHINVKLLLFMKDTPQSTQHNLKMCVSEKKSEY